MEHARSGNRQERIITAHILKAIACEASGNIQRANQDMKEALEMAAEEEYCRIFMDEGGVVSDVLKRLSTIEFSNATVETARKLKIYIRKLIHSFGVESQALGDHLPDPLSDREMDVLILLSTGLSNHDIAEKLFISKDTGRTAKN
jgi:LuxR family maltose regulon positive regulatory protein